MDDFTLRFIDYRSAVMPVYYCLGARLRIFDLEPSQSGQTTALLLQREGDCALLPIDDLILRTDGQRWQRSHPDDLVTHATAALAHDGWQHVGKITITFEGEDCDHPLST